MADDSGKKSDAKRRRNRKKKKSNNSNKDDKNQNNVASSTPASTATTVTGMGSGTKLGGDSGEKMNPHAILRNKIIAEGFSEAEIDKAMEEMWNLNLAYDEFDAVLKYLQTDNKTSEAAAAAPVENADTADTNGNAQNEHYDNDEAEAKYDTDDAEEDLEEEVAEEVPAEEEAPPQAAPAKPPKSMAERLDMVADFENLTDAVFALTEWVGKAAKRGEVEDLCAATKTSALPTMFRRSITECEENSKFEMAVLPAMVRLMSALLSKCGIEPTAAAETRDNFETMMKQARRVYLLEQPGAEEFADRVSRFIVSRISLVAEETKFTSANGHMNGHSSEDTSLTVNEGDQPLASDADKGIAELLSKREVNKTAAKRFGAAVHSACSSLTTQNGMAPANIGNLRETEIERADIMMALVGSNAKSDFDQQKMRLEELRSTMQSGESDDIKQLRTRVEEIESERQMIAQRIAELKQSIQNLEAHDASLCGTVVELENQIESECGVASAEASRLGEELAEATKAVKFGTSVKSLVDLVKTYDDSLEKAANGAEGDAAEVINLEEVASTKMEAFLSRVQSYFSSDVKCVEYLKGRLVTSQKLVADLKIEIAECEGLGMTTTVGEMEKTLEERETLISTDTALLQRVAEDASAMFESLINRLEEYKAARAAGALALAPIHAESLYGIPFCVQKLGISDGSVLDEYMTTYGGLSPRNTDPQIVPKTGTKVAPIGTPKSNKKETEQGTAMPKFTWASANKATEKTTGQKTSLLDIQKEELQSRNEP